MSLFGEGWWWWEVAGSLAAAGGLGTLPQKFANVCCHAGNP